MDKEEMEKERQKEREFFKKFEGKKVTLIAKSGIYGCGERELKGRILQKGDGDFAFLPKGHKTRGKDVTLGLFDGFLATITVKNITEGW